MRMLSQYLNYSYNTTMKVPKLLAKLWIMKISSGTKFTAIEVNAEL